MSEPSAAGGRLAAAALAALFAGFCALYGWEAWRHGTPIIFSDELEFTQLSRAIAETGHAARRGQSHFFDSIITYLWAPAWRIHNVQTAYRLVKLINVALMTSAMVPAYFLARIVASRPAALFAAAGTASIPAFSYSALLLQEPLAYPWAALGCFLAVKAIATRSRHWTAAAIAIALLGPIVRGELAMLPAVLALAGFFYVATGPWGRRHMAAWSRWDWAGVIALGLGVLIFVNAVLSQASHSWELTTRNYKGRIFDLGFQAAAHFTIGIGLLPVVAGLAVLLSFRAARTAETRAFACVGWAVLLAFGTYTGIKAAYLSTTLATRVEERNLIYVAPVLFAAAAVWLDRPRVRVAPALAALGAVGFLLVWKPYELGYGYFEAPGNGVLALGNREFIWTGQTERTILLFVLAFCGIVMLLPTIASIRKRPVSETWVAAGRGMLAVLPVVVVAWGLTGEIYTASGFRHGADMFLANLAKPVNWVDRASGGKSVVYFGQNLTHADPNGIHLDEFWNRSIVKVWAFDGSAPGPGPTQSQDLVSTNGTGWPPPGTAYALADLGITLAGRPVATRGNLRLYKIDGTLRLASAVDGVEGDGWSLGHAAWSVFRTPGATAGTIAVTFQRTRGCTNVPNGHARVRVGALVIGSDKHPALGRVRSSTRVSLPDCETRVVRLPSGKPPFQVEVQISPTYRLSDYGYSSDLREVGAVVGFGFVPRSH